MTRTVTALFLWLACLAPLYAASLKTRSLPVVATAYNSTRAQTDRSHSIAAWGDHLGRLPKGVRAIAVSPDLLRKGLKYRQRVRLSGQPGWFVVLDKMPRRWKNRVDIHYGKDIKAARRWGRKRVTLFWTSPAQFEKLPKVARQRLPAGKPPAPHSQRHNKASARKGHGHAHAAHPKHKPRHRRTRHHGHRH